MRPVAKAGLVTAGYLAAVGIALLAVKMRVAATSGPDRQQYSGMYAFGDSLLFLAVFGLAATAPTGAALFFLRPRPAFWTRLSVASLAVASTGLVATLIYLAPKAVESGSVLAAWSSFAVLRILLAPLLVLFFLLSGLLAPNRSARIALLAATTIEAFAFACVAFVWFRQGQ